MLDVGADIDLVVALPKLTDLFVDAYVVGFDQKKSVMVDLAVQANPVVVQTTDSSGLRLTCGAAYLIPDTRILSTRFDMAVS